MVNIIENLNDFKNVIQFANEQFNCDFEQLQPKIYSHFEAGKTYVEVQDGKTIGMMSTYEFQFKKLKCLSIGTVCVDVNHRGESVMTKLFQYLEDNVFSNYDILFLSGNKQRYENFKFAHVMENINYRIEVKSFPNSASICEVSDDKNGKLFELFDKYSKNLSRNKESFFDILKTNNRKVFLISNDSNQSYAVYDSKDNVVVEICGNLDRELVVQVLGKHLKLSKIEVRSLSNFHEKQFVDCCQSYSIFTRGNVRIQNIEKVIANLCVPKDRRKSRIKFSVVGKSYSLKVVKRNIQIKKVTRAKNNFSLLEFTYAVFNYGGSDNIFAKRVKCELSSSIFTIEGI